MNRRYVQLLLVRVFLALILYPVVYPAGSRASANAVKIANIHTGDLIFLDMKCRGLCSAIADATKRQFKVTGPDLSHVGILESNGKHGTFVFEAWPNGGVIRTPLAEVLERVKGGENEKDGFYIGRFKREFRPQVLAAVQRARRLLGKPYDSEFLMGGGKYYCSSLVYESFFSGVSGSSVGSGFFALTPMTFGKPGSIARKAWDDYFKKIGMKTPEGKLGISPLGIYLQGKAKYFE